MKKKIQKPFSVEAYNNGAKVETRGGAEVRILCTDLDSAAPVVATSSGCVRQYYADGKFLCSADDSILDLVIVEEVDEAEKWNEDAERKGYSFGLYGVTESIGLSKSIFATEKQAKSAFAMARISQIMMNDPRFGGVITDEEWEDIEEKYVVCRVGGTWVYEKNCHYYNFLAFHTEDQRDLFLEEYEGLVKDYLMI